MPNAIKAEDNVKLYEVEQLTTANSATVTALLGTAQIGATRNVTTFADTAGDPPPYKELTMRTLDGDIIVQHGEWVAKGPFGELTKHTPGEFTATFSSPPVVDTTASDADTPIRPGDDFSI